MIIVFVCCFNISRFHKCVCITYSIYYKSVRQAYAPRSGASSAVQPALEFILQFSDFNVTFPAIRYNVHRIISAHVFFFIVLNNSSHFKFLYICEIVCGYCDFFF